MKVHKMILILSTVSFIEAFQDIPPELAPIMLQFQQSCIDNTGSDAGYLQMIASIEPMESCVRNQFNMTELQSDMTLLNTESTSKKFFNKYCPTFNESVSCLDDGFEGIAKCAVNDTDQVKDILTNIAYGVLDLLCQNDGQMLLDFQIPEFGACVMWFIKYDVGVLCGFSNITSNAPITRFGEKECQEFEESRECIKRHVDGCPSPGVFEIFDVVYNVISETNYCKQAVITNVLWKI